MAKTDVKTYRTFGEIIEAVRKVTSYEEKAAILKVNYSEPMKWLFQGAYGKVRWLLPPGAPPFKASDAPDGESTGSLLQEAKTLYIFTDAPKASKAMKASDRESKFITLLESLTNKEAELLIEIKDKSIKGVTKEFLEKTFPGIFEGV